MSNAESTGSLTPARRRRALAMLIVGSTVVVGGAAAVQIAAGAYTIGPVEAVAALVDGQVWGDGAVLMRLLMGDGAAQAMGFDEAPALDTATLIVWNVRLPRVLVGMMAGVNLALAGGVFQALTRNELASPYLLGVSSGAGLAVLIVLVIYPAMGAHLSLAAAAGGAGAFVVVYAIAWQHGTSPVRLVLAGVIVAAIAGSIQTAIFLTARDLGMVHNAMAWMTGSLTGVGWPHVRMIAPWTIACVALGFVGVRHMDVLTLGDAAARSLGMRVERTRFALAAVAIMAAASSIAVCGLIGFVGLIVPHIVRHATGSAHRGLLLGCLFVGPALLCGADATARLALSPVQMPVGIVTGILGGTYFLYLMRKRTEIGKL